MAAIYGIARSGAALHCCRRIAAADDEAASELVQLCTSAAVQRSEETEHAKREKTGAKVVNKRRTLLDPLFNRQV